MRPLFIGIGSLCICLAPNGWQLTPGVWQSLFSQTDQTQRVSIRVDTKQTQGPLRPIHSYFGYDEPNYTYMKDGKKLLSQLAAASPVTGLCACPQPADYRRWNGCTEMGLDQCLH